MKRVLVVTIDQWLDALHGPSIFDLLDSLSERGYTVEVLLPSGRERSSGLGRLPVTALPVAQRSYAIQLLLLYLRAISLLRGGNLSAIIADYYLILVLVLGRFLSRGKRILLILSRPVEPRIKIARQLFRLALIFAPWIADFVTAISPFEARDYSRMGRIPMNRMFVVPSPVGRTFMNYQIDRDRNELRRQLGMDSLIDKTVILYHGSLHRSREPVKVIDALMEALGEQDEMVLLIVGDGPSREVVASHVQDKRSRNVLVWGRIPYSSIPDIIAASDVGLVVLPNNEKFRYQCPTKLVELLAEGKPVVATDLPGIRWVAADSPMVFYVRSLDPDELREAIKTAVRRSRESAYEDSRANARFSSQRIAERLANAIERKSLQ